MTRPTASERRFIFASTANQPTLEKSRRLPDRAFARLRAAVRTIECGSQILVPKTASLQNTGLRLIVDIIDTKALGVTRSPFKVVEQGPHEVAAHIDTLIDGVRDGAYVGFDIGASVFIPNASINDQIRIGCTVFGDEQGRKVVVTIQAQQQVG